jgi:hypothetical protein
MSLVPIASKKAATLEGAEYCYRLSNFDQAFAISKDIVAGGSYQKWTTKKQHEAVKAFIRNGHHANRCWK